MLRMLTGPGGGSAISEAQQEWDDAVVMEYTQRERERERGTHTLGTHTHTHCRCVKTCTSGCE